MHRPMRRRLLVIAALLAAALGGYALYWQAAAGTLARGIADWAAQRRAEGYTISHGAPDIGGFPFRLEARLAAPAIDSPRTVGATAWRWSGPTLILHARPWSPLDAEAAAPGRHDVEIDDNGRLRGFVIDAIAATGRASFAADGRVTGAEARLTDILVAEDGAEDRPLSAEILSIEVRPDDPAGGDHGRPSLGFSLALTGVLLPPGTEAPLGRELETLEVDGAVMGRIDTGHRSLRDGLASWRDDGGTLEIARVVGRWGPLYLTGDGTFALDGRLQPIGAMSTTLSGHAAAIDALVEAGAIGARDGGLAKILLGVLSRPSPVDGTDELAVPLTLQDGWLWAGPAKLLRLPVISWE